MAHKNKAKKNADWAKSTMTELRLTELANSSLLTPQVEIEWRAREDETRPQPGQGEVVIFVDHLTRGFRPPGSRFFRNVL